MARVPPKPAAKKKPSPPMTPAEMGMTGPMPGMPMGPGAAPPPSPFATRPPAGMRAKTGKMQKGRRR